MLSSYPDRWRRVARAQSIGSIFNVGGVLAEGDGHSLLHLAAVTAAVAAAIGDVIRLFNDHSGVPALWTPGGGCRLSARPCVGQSGVGAERGRAKGRVREPACAARACPRVCLDFERMPHANPTRDNARRASHAAMHPSLHQNRPACCVRRQVRG